MKLPVCERGPCSEKTITRLARYSRMSTQLCHFGVSRRSRGMNIIHKTPSIDHCPHVYRVCAASLVQPLPQIGQSRQIRSMVANLLRGSVHTVIPRAIHSEFTAIRCSPLQPAAPTSRIERSTRVVEVNRQYVSAISSTSNVQKIPDQAVHAIVVSFPLIRRLTEGVPPSRSVPVLTPAWTSLCPRWPLVPAQNP